MSITLSQTKADYLDQVATGLAGLPEEDREEVIQDLEAHLAELSDDTVIEALGTPAEFVAEFRSSAGLDGEPERIRFPRIRKARQNLDDLGQRLSGLINWPVIRPVWIWLRGWVLVSTLALFDGRTFVRFPIPSLGGSTLTGLAMVAVATAASLWLDRARSGFGQGASTLLSAGAAIGLFLSLVNPVYQNVYDSEPYYPGQLTAADGSVIENIYAYDLDGVPMDVLLYDQIGRPILSLPDYTYEQAGAYPGSDNVDYGSGQVEFQRDQLGRIIPNFYPLQLFTWDNYGNLVAMLPPSLGFPEANSEENVVSTTISTPRSGQ
jgi:uncharacterized membrane protein